MLSTKSCLVLVFLFIFLDFFLFSQLLLYYCMLNFFFKFQIFSQIHSCWFPVSVRDNWFFFSLFCEKLYIKKTGLLRNLYCPVWENQLGFYWSWHFGIGGVYQRLSQLLKIIKSLDDRFKRVKSTSLLLKIRRTANIYQWAFCRVEIKRQFFLGIYLYVLAARFIALTWFCFEHMVIILIGCIA